MDSRMWWLREVEGAFFFFLTFFFFFFSCETETCRSAVKKVGLRSARSVRGTDARKKGCQPGVACV